MRVWKRREAKRGMEKGGGRESVNRKCQKDEEKNNEREKRNSVSA